jgi:limonene-1,2-epoxide hydrolase
MTPKELVTKWVKVFNQGDADALADLYDEQAINHQVAAEFIQGKENIRKMFAAEFAQAEMVCIIENIFEDHEWAILEWKDPKGLRGCGFFHVVNDKIIFQRGYWDMLTFLREQGLPLPTE